MMSSVFMEDNALETPTGISQFDMDDGGFVIPPENLDHTVSCSFT